MFAVVQFTQPDAIIHEKADATVSMSFNSFKLNALFITIKQMSTFSRGFQL